jgi:hypothetical protein
MKSCSKISMPSNPAVNLALSLSQKSPAIDTVTVEVFMNG